MTPEEHRREHKRLQDLTHRNLMNLMDSELSLALTMSELAQTEAGLGDDAHAKILLTKVREALDTVRRHMTDNRVSDDEKAEIEERLQELTERLDTAKQDVSEETSSTRREIA